MNLKFDFLNQGQSAIIRMIFIAYKIKISNQLTFQIISLSTQMSKQARAATHRVTVMEVIAFTPDMRLKLVGPAIDD